MPNNKKRKGKKLKRRYKRKTSSSSQRKTGRALPVSMQANVVTYEQTDVVRKPSPNDIYLYQHDPKYIWGHYVVRRGTKLIHTQDPNAKSTPVFYLDVDHPPEYEKHLVDVKRDVDEWFRDAPTNHRLPLLIGGCHGNSLLISQRYGGETIFVASGHDFRTYVSNKLKEDNALLRSYPLLQALYNDESCRTIWDLPTKEMVNSGNIVLGKTDGGEPELNDLEVNLQLFNEYGSVYRTWMRERTTDVIWRKHTMN